MKSGIVCIIGRPNVGKSTLLNKLLKHKVSITSPKPQTTRFPIQAVFDDERGQILFVDTPGIMGKVDDTLSKSINKTTENSLTSDVDIVMYMVDHTRQRDFEENKALGMVRKVQANKIMIINKIDVKVPSYMVQYKFMEEEFEKVIEISALDEKHLQVLVDTLFEYLPEREPLIDSSQLVQPAINMDSKLFISEIIREKAFLNLRREAPYRVTVVVDEIIERESGSLFIKARILATEERYTGMVIGKNGSMIKEISMAARKELERATDKRVFLDLTAQTDSHWMEIY